ncbi:hypothetical protein [[Enterobacter] lignolyticus]|nr:hypothetical protein [[Enterobacter] lignolyticus]
MGLRVQVPSSVPIFKKKTSKDVFFAFSRRLLINKLSLVGIPAKSIKSVSIFTSLMQVNDVVNIYRTFIIAGAFAIAGCSSSSSSSLNTVNEINGTAIPVIHANNRAAASTEQASVTSFYQENSLQISKLSHSLKSEWLQDVKPAEVFDQSSNVSHVYAALSKLEEMSEMNEIYRKDNNIEGLKAINLALKPWKVNA